MPKRDEQSELLYDLVRIVSASNRLEKGISYRELEARYGIKKYTFYAFEHGNSNNAGVLAVYLVEGFLKGTLLDNRK